MNVLVWSPAMNYSRRPASWVVLLGCVCVTSLLQAAEPTLCKAGEISVFSCRLENAKTMSICASTLPVRGYVEYRFGTRSKIELTYSASIDRQDHEFHRGEVVYVGRILNNCWLPRTEISVVSEIRWPRAA